MTAPPPPRVVVHKLDAHGEELWRYEGVVLERSETHLTLEARFDRADVDFKGLQLRRGDRFVESFYSDRWYNVFAVHDGESGNLKGWYCNITRPASLGSSHIYSEDLALDLVVTPEGHTYELDRDEFNALELDPADQRDALLALEDLQRLAAAGVGPFSV